MCALNFNPGATFVLANHSPNSPSRNRHCLPILIAGISRHSAQRQIVLGETPSHFATAAVVRSGSRTWFSFSIVRRIFIRRFSDSGRLKEHVFRQDTRRPTPTRLSPQNLVATKQRPGKSRIQFLRFQERCQVTVALTTQYWRRQSAHGRRAT